MTGHTATVRCPNCDHPCETATPEPPPRAGAASDVEELACPCCGWAFAVRTDGRAFDDGGPDADGPLAVGADDPDAVPGATVRCGRCARVLDVDGEPGPVRCPFCGRSDTLVWSDRRGTPVPLTCGRSPDWLTDPDPDDWSNFDPDDIDGCEDDDRTCPNGCAVSEDGYEQCGLPDGWVLCSGCGLAYHDPDVWADGAWKRAAGGTRRVVVGPGERVRDLGRAFAAVAADGVVRLRPGTYHWPADPPPPGVTVAALGPPGSVMIDVGDDAAEVVGGSVRFAGLAFRGAVDVRQAVADFRRCTFAGPLAVLGGRATAWFRGCRFHGGGVWCHHGGAARLIRTAVAGAANHGAWVTGGGLVTLDRCRVTGCGGDGVRADAPGGAFLRRCVVAGNAAAGVRVGGRAVVAGGRVAGNGGPAVVVEAAGRAVVRRCRVDGDVAAEPGGRVRVRRPRPGDRADDCFVVG